MVVLLHAGHGHPDMLWITGAVLFGFIISLIAINFYYVRTRSDRDLFSETSDNEVE